MKYALFLNNLPVHISSETPYTGTPQLKEFIVDGKPLAYNNAKSIRQLDSMEEAEAIAKFATESTGALHLAYDDGASTSHRFGIIEAPKVGDEVSYAFNGDYYPCGKIVRITPGFRIYAKDENDVVKMFNRSKNRSNWTMKGGTWSLVQGHIFQQNPSF
jgi:hypothetical protein